jgi:hypothetical protein
MRKEFFLLGLVIGMVLILGIAVAFDNDRPAPTEQNQSADENIGEENDPDNDAEVIYSGVQPAKTYDEEDEWSHVGGPSGYPSRVYRYDRSDYPQRRHAGKYHYRERYSEEPVDCPIYHQHDYFYPDLIPHQPWYKMTSYGLENFYPDLC